MGTLRKCPFCGGIMLECITEEEAKEAFTNRVNEARVIKAIPDLAGKWNATSSKRVPYDFIRWLTEQLKGSVGNG